MKVQQVLNCSFERWYETFKHLTIKSEIIPIPQDVLEYLKSDGTLILPQSCQDELDADLKANEFDENDFDESDQLPLKMDVPQGDADDQDTCSTSSTSSQPIVHPDFKEFDAKLRRALDKFSNKVFVKLNWSSAKDAYWALNKLSCQRLTDVYMLLKSSDFINHDLTEPFWSCEDEMTCKPTFDYYLVVREWINILPSMEFRCFVKSNRLVGISQRDCRTFYKMLLENKASIEQRIVDFYERNIVHKFSDDSFVFDVCMGKTRTKLMDFNPFGPVTDSLLFSWEELNELVVAENTAVDFRLIENEYGINVGSYDIYSRPRETLRMGLDVNSNHQTIDELTNMINENIQLQKAEDQMDSSSKG